MKLSSQWIREFVDLPVDDRRLAQDLTAIGIAVEGISGEGANTVFEMEIGTNRPDAMNHHGVAREAAALYGVELRPLETSAAKAAHNGDAGNAALKCSSTQTLHGAAKVAPPAPKGALQKASAGTPEGVPFPSVSRRSGESNDDFAIDIEDAEGCGRYTAQIVHGVKIKASPVSIANRLVLVDQRPINNAADASNYTLWEMGHPTHAFDLDLLEGNKIVVRRARHGETLKTLDGVDRKLSPEDLIIADANKPVALAGVMGGFDTMITEKTRNILIESAWFDPVAVRKTAKRLGMHTDASHRFERGADYCATPLACALVAQRIIESGGGELEGTAIDAIAREVDQASVALRISQVHRILGKKLETHEIVGILQRLGFELVPEPGMSPEFSVRIPSWRLDVEREIDLIEEIARLHGYNNFPNTLPSFSGAVVETPKAAKRARLRGTLLALGYHEAVSLSFIGHEDAETFSSSPVVEIANALSEEASLMRSSLVPGMLDMLSYNLNRGTENVRLFEIGEVYEATGAETAEHNRICLGTTATALRHDTPQGSILDKSETASGLDLFRSLKGDVETLLCLFEHRSLAFDSQTPEYYHAGRSARVLMDGATAAFFGQLHPQFDSGRKLRGEVYLAELFADRVWEHALRKLFYRPLAKFPSVERDFSFLYSDQVTFEKIRAAIQSLGLTELRSFIPVEIFHGGSVPAGQYSILLRATFQSLEHTLREDEVAEWSEKIVRSLRDLGGTQRA